MPKEEQKYETNTPRHRALHGRVTERRLNAQIKKMIDKKVGRTRVIHLPKSFMNIYPAGMNKLNARMNSFSQHSATVSTVLSFKGNSFYQAGPRVNNAGASSTNVPSGLYYLLSSNNVAGATAPYEFYRIHSSRIKVRITSYNPSSTTINTQGIKCVVYPSLLQSNAGTLITQATEFPRAKFKQIPPTTTASQITITNTMDSPTMYGMKTALGNTDEYLGTAVLDPTNIWFWQVYLTSSDGATAVDYNIDVTIDYDFDVIGRNTFVTTVPT